MVTFAKRKQAGIRIVSTFLFFFSLLTLSSISSQVIPGYLMHLHQS